MHDVAAWLRGLGLERYEAAFRENAIDAAVLPRLTSEDLKEIGVAALGHRKRLLEAIAALPGEGHVRPPAPAPAVVPSRPRGAAVTRAVGTPRPSGGSGGRPRSRCGCRRRAR